MSSKKWFIEVTDSVKLYLLRQVVPKLRGPDHKSSVTFKCKPPFWNSQKGPTNLRGCVGSAFRLCNFTKPAAENLGVLFNSNISFEHHVAKLVQSCFYHLRNNAKIRAILIFRGTETVIHPFISSHLDYCNSLFSCLNQKTLKQLQIVQNSVAWLLTKTWRYDHSCTCFSVFTLAPCLF